MILCTAVHKISCDLCYRCVQKMIKMLNENTNTKLDCSLHFRAELIEIVMRAEHEIGNCSLHFRAELKSGFQSLIVNEIDL